MKTTKQQRLAAAALVVLGAIAQAQTVPAPPSSPAPVVNYEYDAQGNPTKTVQSPGTLNLTTQATYDPLDRRANTTDAKSGVTAFSYDGRDQITRIADPRALQTSYTVDGLGNVRQLTSPDTGTASLTYDAAGNLKTRTDSRGVLGTYSYDALNRLTSLVYSQAGQSSMTFTWQYDLGTVPNGIGRLGEVDFPGGSLRYGYDAQGRVVSVTEVAVLTSSLQVSVGVSYGYDTAGHVSSITYPSGRKLTINYTGGLPSAISLAPTASGTPATLLSAIQWQPFGAARGWQWQMASGVQANDRVFDTSGRLVRYRMGNVIRDLTYDSADRIASYTHYDATTGAAQTGLNEGFSYDELGRLTGITTATASWTIGYDANGNRTSVTQNGSTNTYGVSATSNWLDSITNPARSFGYDAAGNTQTDSSGYSATYDLSGRMKTLTKAGVTATYAYDNLGRRISKVTNPYWNPVVFVYDLSGHLLGEYDAKGNPIREYVWLGDIPVAVFTNDPANWSNPPLVYYIHADHLNTPRVVVDKNSAVRWRWLAEPFGTTAPETNPSNLGAFTFNLRFPGQYFDQESGLSYNYFRSFDASIGRYAQSDPIGLAGGINTYAYAYGNPVSYTDPNGEFVPMLLYVAVETAPVWAPYLAYATAALGVGSAAYLTLHPMPDPSVRHDARRPDAANRSCSPDDPCSEFRYQLDRLWDAIKQSDDSVMAAMRLGRFPDDIMQRQQLNLKLTFNSLAAEFNRNCVPRGWAPETRHFDTRPPTFPSPEDLHDFYGR